MTAITCTTLKDAMRAAIIDSCRTKLTGWHPRQLKVRALVPWRAGRACPSKMHDARIAPVLRACHLIPPCRRGVRYPQSRAFQTTRPEFSEYASDLAQLPRLRGRIR